MKAMLLKRRSLRPRRGAPIRRPAADPQRLAISAVLGHAAGEQAPRGERRVDDGPGLGPGTALTPDQRAFLEPRLGADLGAVRLHADGTAAATASALGARAFAVGHDIGFAPGRYRPETAGGRFLLAHELAHVLQQRQGVGEPSQAHERQADQAAARVARGESAALASAAGGRGTGAAPVVQRYAEVSGEPYDRLSDDGRMAVKDHGRDAWAESANIARSNQVLDALNSKAKIEELSGADVTVAPPGQTTTRVLKKFRMADRAGGEVELRDDCGTANQQMLGAEAAGYKSFVAVTQRGTTREYTAASTYRKDDLRPGGNLSTTESMSGEIYVRIFAREFNRTLTRVQALTEWDKLAAAEQTRLSRKYGINDFAVPQVGQGVTIGSERDMPGASSTGYNFHFGFNLMASGHDYITLEDYAKSGVRYYFDMYGPASKKQAWSQAESNVDAIDARFTVMVVQHPESLKGSVNTAGTLFEDDPAVITSRKALDKGDQVMILRKGHSWMKVKALTGRHAGDSGWIMNKYFSDT